jgi:hypothetical protein
MQKNKKFFTIISTKETTELCKGNILMIFQDFYLHFLRLEIIL